MAIRGPHRPDAGVPAPREQPQSPLQRLVDFGMARTPAEALKVLREILALLAAAGLPVPKTGAPEQRLSSTLKELQKQNGLPQTGQLDQRTVELLQKKGLLPGKETSIESIDQKTSNSPATETRFTVGGPRLGAEFGLPRAGGDTSAGTQKPRTVETEQARVRAEAGRPEIEVDLKNLLHALRSAGFVGFGKGKEQLQDALKKLQRVDGLPPTGKLDAATVQALERRGVLDAATAQTLKEQDPSHQRPSASTSDDARAAAQQARQDATGRGTVRGDGSAQGRGGADGTSGGRGAHGGAGTTVGDARDDGVVDDGDDDGAADDFGNNYAGDDDDDDRRGDANLAGDDDAGSHWEAPSLARQIDAALSALHRDDDGAGAATYGWEVVLLRPGIYASRQPAEELLRLRVSRAGPFDPAWQEALRALNEKLQTYEPQAAPIDEAALRLALQRARYRA